MYILFVLQMGEMCVGGVSWGEIFLSGQKLRTKCSVAMVSFRGLVFGRSEYKEENHQNQGMCNLFYEIGWHSGDLKEGVWYGWRYEINYL